VLAPNEIERLLVVTAHPDDVDFGAAGSIATLTDAGVDVTYCIVTDGDAGGSDRSMPRDEMARLRRVEQTDAAKHVGVHDLVFLGWPDGRVEATLALREAISRLIRQVQPTVVICQSAQRNLDRIYAGHPDHLAAGEAAICAVYPDARNPFAFPQLLGDEGLEPWTVSEVWIMGAGFAGDQQGYAAIDITDQFSRKIDALMCHQSQHTDRQRITELMDGWTTATAAAFGLPEGRRAEAFRVVDTR
jgi:LmbE family N-acetylglucosaminyl deacetylase